MLNAPDAGNGVGSDEDPAAAFLAQQESEISGIENDEGFSILDSGEVPSSLGDSSAHVVHLVWEKIKVIALHSKVQVLLHVLVPTWSYRQACLRNSI
ncbi:hypothetical protein JOQ06_016483 [Pogonophryne albipinna]|uniref:Uncharacterized protein n=1 Tax=Pogonophryne albipinna TaxID=1090488 RepID=A0AAD6F7A6_9TELE|nr:hypothetical protein JOQ06_016483 [Pogonophryne albipinna]